MRLCTVYGAQRALFAEGEMDEGLREVTELIPDGRRRVFAIDGVPFGITIC